jgi:hypothetical protein
VLFSISGKDAEAMFMTHIATTMLLAVTWSGWLADSWVQDRMFPDGLVHDFGKVPQGTKCQHAFRLVNTTNAPIQIMLLRCSGSTLTARWTEHALEPNEEGKVEVLLDTRRFVGRKTISMYLTLENGTEVAFQISAESDPVP